MVGIPWHTYMSVQETPLPDRTLAMHHLTAFATLLTRPFATLAAAARLNLSTGARLAELRRLDALSDAELTGLGLDRDGLMRHVFADFIAP